MVIPRADTIAARILEAARELDADQFEVYFGVVTEISVNGETVSVARQAVIGSVADSGVGMVATARVAGMPMPVGTVVLCMRDRKNHYVLGTIGGDAYATSQAASGVFLKIDDDAPTAASNASTSTYASLYSDVIALPTGTWSGDHLVLATFKNSVAGNGATIRCGAPSASGGTTITDPTANAPFTGFDRGAVASVSGNVTFTGEYRASGGGTVTPQRWLRIIALQRVS